MEERILEPSTEAQKKWSAILKEAQESGLSGAEFCRRKGLNIKVFYWWRKRFGLTRKRGGKNSLVPVVIREKQKSFGVFPQTFEVSFPDGRSLKVPQGFDPKSLKRLIEILSLKCLALPEDISRCRLNGHAQRYRRPLLSCP